MALVALVDEFSDAGGYVPDIGLRCLEFTLRLATATGAAVTELDFSAKSR